jgi:sugar lactone lactonase YvrE
MIELKCEWEIPAILGEGALWVGRENALYWVDVVGKKVHRYGVSGGARKTWSFDTEVTSLAARKQGGFVGTTRHGIAFFDFGSDVVTPEIIAEFETDVPGNRFNDGKADVHGRFWTGTVDEAGWKDETGSLYRMDRDLSVQKMAAPYICSNGPAFSADNRTFYHTETMKGTVFAFDFGEDGGIRNKRPFVKLKDGEGGPDGMTVDNEDCLWVCHFGGGRVTRHSPRSELLQTLIMPVPNVTNCAFGGPNLDTLFITTARYGMSDDDVKRYPLAGSLFSCVPGVKGLAAPMFAG